MCESIPLDTLNVRALYSSRDFQSVRRLVFTGFTYLKHVFLESSQLMR